MNTVEEYIDGLSDDRKLVVEKLRSIINANIPDGFSEQISYGMIGWVVPHSLYPGGYHCTPELPLPFLSVASQKRHIGLYHMGIYAYPQLMQWFVDAYPEHCNTKLDMGKSCIRFKNMKKIPYDLIAELVGKMTPQQWIDIYESQIKR